MAEDSAKPAIPTSLEFYSIKASIISPEARRVLNEYSKIPEDQIEKHVESIREKAFKIFPYPCIGMFRFLNFGLPSTSAYDEVLERVKKGETLLDLGCCFGQELRRLVFDGAPSAKLYGSDLRVEYFELGYELFRDRGAFAATFIAADVFDESSALTALAGQMDMMYTGSFFHLFDLDKQVQVAKRVVQLLAPRAGSMLLGRQVGYDQAGEVVDKGLKGEYRRFRHNGSSWRELWDRVGEETGTRWQVETATEEWGNSREQLGLWQGKYQGEKGARKLSFVVRRL